MMASTGLWHHVRRAHGDAPWVVLLHGLLEDHKSWAPVAAPLGQRYNVLQIDLPGHGGSRPWCAETALAHTADLVAQLIQSLGIVQAHIIGFSMGARVAFLIAANHGARCRSLVLEDMGPARNPVAYEHFRTLFDHWLFQRQEITATERDAWLARKDGPNGLRTILSHAMEPLENGAYRWYFEPVVVLQLVSEVAQRDFWGELRRVKCDTLIVRAEHSTHLSAEDAHEMAGAIPSARLSIVAATRHAVHREVPVYFTETLIDWIENIESMKGAGCEMEVTSMTTSVRPEPKIQNEEIRSLRTRFPILNRNINGRPLIYLDNAATTLKPVDVIEVVTDFYNNYTANIHRGAHILSERASNEFEKVRELTAAYLRTGSTNIVFTSGTTEAMQLVANGLERSGRTKVVSTESEHHSNLLPWADGKLRLVPTDEAGRLSLELMEEAVKRHRPDAVCVSHASNVTGNIHPIKSIADIAHRYDALMIVDAAQSVPHMRLSPEELGCDLMAFSAHKMLGPSGVGVLWGTTAALESLGTPKRGGGMVNRVTASEYVPREIPWRFEAGTPNIEGVIGFGAALQLLMSVDQQQCDNHLDGLAKKLAEIVSRQPYLRPLGDLAQGHRLSLVSFALKNKNVRADQFARILSDSFGIMARSGSLCAHPLFARLGHAEAVRLSAYLYNTEGELYQVEGALTSLAKIFK